MGRFRYQCARFAILIVFVSYVVMANYVETPKSAKRRGISLLRVGKRYGESFYPWNIQTANCTENQKTSTKLPMAATGHNSMVISNELFHLFKCV
ncbi:unnamed protein product [Callosobruchus maculatus]|uniref:Uncharacterized protein n=1 Tax=Callosobruchus maculatus TaxID=64391 RepID=A0A653C3R3_CALMS|nr:unnamed protein product [Callosobruchus maculatus]